MHTIRCGRPLRIPCLAPSPPIEPPACQTGSAVLFFLCVARFQGLEQASTKGDKFLRFCHKTRSIPTKGQEGDTYLVRAGDGGGPHPRRLSGQDLHPKNGARPFSWTPAEFVDPS